MTAPPSSRRGFDGMIDGWHAAGRGVFSYAVPWLGCWQLARWAAARHGFAIDPDAVVVRTRPDYRFTQSFDPAPLQVGPL
jgi:hypothetical protein